MKYTTDANSVSHGENEFFAVDGVVDIPESFVPVFADFIASGLLVLVDESAPAESAPDEPAADAPSKAKRRKA